MIQLWTALENRFWPPVEVQEVFFREQKNTSVNGHAPNWRGWYYMQSVLDAHSIHVCSCLSSGAIIIICIWSIIPSSSALAAFNQINDGGNFYFFWLYEV